MNPMYSRLIDRNGKYADPTSKEAIKKIQGLQVQYVELETKRERSFEFIATDKKGHKTHVIRYY